MNNRILNDGCHWELTWNGRKASEIGLDDASLDLFLLRHLKDFDIKGATFYTRAQDITEGKLESIKTDISNAEVKSSKSFDEFGEPDDDAKYLVIPNSVGVTKALYYNFNDGGPLVTSFNTDKYKDKKAEAIEKGETFTLPNGETLAQSNVTLGYSPTKWVDLEEDSWKDLTELGTKVHKIFESVFKGEEPKNEGLDDSIFNSVITQVKAFRQQLEQKYPGCKFYPEFAIKSKNLSPDALAVLKLDNKDSINGIIDLLVIDANGNAHIYDYKVSRKGIGTIADKNNEAWGLKNNPDIRKENLWASAKKLSATYQTEFYKQMLSGYDIYVADTNILAVKLNLKYEDSSNPYKVTGVESVEVQSNPNHIIKNPGLRDGGRSADKISKLFSIQHTSTSEDAEALSKAFITFFPKSSIIIKREQDQSNIEHYKQYDKYVHKLRPGETGYEDGKIRYRLRFPVFGSKPIYCDVSEVDDKIQEYINNKNDMQSTKYLAFADAIENIKDGGSEINSLLDLVNNNQRNFVQNQFGRYLGSDWQFKSDPIANSLGIFVFKKGAKAEVIVLSADALRQSQNLGKGTSLIGKTDSDKSVDSRKILPALIGNMEMIKAMMYISIHPETFKGFKISEIRAVNPWLGIEMSALNSDLQIAFDLLIRKNPSCGLNRINQSLFLDDRVAVVENAKERVEGLDYVLSSGDNSNPYTAEWFKSKINLFEQRYSSRMDLRGGYQNTPEWNAYQKLYEGYNLCKGIKAHVETDKSDFNATGKVYELNGLVLSSSQFSPSTNIRELAQVIDEYAKEVRLQVYKIGAPIQMAFQEFYKTHGTGAKSFDIFFADKRNLVLKNPDSYEFDGDPVARKTLDLFLKTLAKLRHPEYTTDADLERAKLDEDYYQIPLMEAAFSRQVRNVGLFKTLKNKFKQHMTLTQGLFMGEELEGGMSAYISDHQELYNRLKFETPADREARLDKYGRDENDTGPSMFETDLELVMNASLVAFCRSNVSKDYIPSIAGLKMALDAIDSQGSTRQTKDMQNIRKQFDRIVKSKFYGESIVDPHLQGVLKWINMIKYGFTKLTLSLNSRSFLRESLQGIYTGLARAGVNLYPGITRKSYNEGIAYVVQEAHKNFSGVSMLQQLNSIYGMANQSLTQLAGQRRVNWAHINHWGQDTLFLTCTAPDFLHRMSLLVAKMKHDGCFDAHSIDKNTGILKYDFSKDGRFQHLIKKDTSSAEYLKEKALYLAMIDDFKRAGFKNTDGSELNGENLDALPQAYTRQEGQSIKNYADYLYGHYDEESKSLLYDSFLGSLFLQYKTFLTSRLEQWTMHEGVYNTAELVQQFDDNGNPLYVKFYEDDDGTPHKEILLQNEYEALPDEQKEKISLYYDYTGLPMEGMLQESFKVYKSLLSLDSEKIKEIWSDPTTRAMFKLQIHDLWFMAAMTLIVNLIVGNLLDVDKPTDYLAVRRAAKKNGAISSFAYDIIVGSMADSQLPNILGSFTDKPPVVAAVQRFGTSSWKVITGDANIAYWMTRNIGALRDFEGLVKNIENA